MLRRRGARRGEFKKTTPRSQRDPSDSKPTFRSSDGLIPEREESARLPLTPPPTTPAESADCPLPAATRHAPRPPKGFTTVFRHFTAALPGRCSQVPTVDQTEAVCDAALPGDRRFTSSAWCCFSSRRRRLLRTRHPLNARPFALQLSRLSRAAHARPGSLPAPGACVRFG